MSDDGSHIGRLYYCAEAVIPIRSTPSESAEMVSQLIFGDIAYHLAQEGSWTKIRCEFDDYEGWVDQKMLSNIQADSTLSKANWKWAKNASLQYPGIPFPQRLPLGARVPVEEDHQLTDWSGSAGGISISSKSEFFGQEELSDIVSLAYHFLHTPYLWGGCSSFGIDCSGFTQRVFRMAGRKLPRDSRPQEKLGVPISWGDHRAGDLAFFSKPNQFRITHVGIVIEEGKIIHASGRVRIDSLTKLGIVHIDEQTLTHELISIRR